jgi:hypothetical protein
METTVLGILKKACDLVGSGQSLGTRDLAYYAVLETAMVSRGDASLAMLADQKEPAIELLQATIRRIMSALH